MYVFTQWHALNVKICGHWQLRFILLSTGGPWQTTWPDLIKHVFNWENKSPICVQVELTCNFTATYGCRCKVILSWPSGIKVRLALRWGEWIQSYGVKFRVMAWNSELCRTIQRYKLLLCPVQSYKPHQCRGTAQQGSGGRVWCRRFVPMPAWLGWSLGTSVGIGGQADVKWNNTNTSVMVARLAMKGFECARRLKQIAFIELNGYMIYDACITKNIRMTMKLLDIREFMSSIRIGWHV